MTNLVTKFTDLETLLGSDHTEIITALNAIIEALGGAPPSPTTTLIDVVTAIEAQTTAQATQHTAQMALLTDIFNSVDTIITNNSLNAQRLISAIYTTACTCATEAPLLPPVIDVTPSSLEDQAKCRRIQFYLSVFTTWLNDIANYGSSGATITGDVLGTLLAAAGTAAGLTATGAEVGAAAGLPGAVVGAVVGLLVAAVYALGGSVLIGYANDFSSPILQNALLTALFEATTAEEGQTAFQVTVGDAFSPIPAGIINALWWSAWSNDLYSGTPEVDDSAFDGELCAPDVPEVMTISAEHCASAQSIATINSNAGEVQAIEFSNGETLSPSSLSGQPDLTYDHAIFGVTNLNGYWVSSVPNCTMYCNANGLPNFVVTSTPVQIPVSTYYYAFVNALETPFIVTLCPTEP